MWLTDLKLNGDGAHPVQHERDGVILKGKPDIVIAF